MLNKRPFTIKSFPKERWFPVENDYIDIYARHVGAVGSAVYMCLCRHADENQKCFPSERHISEELDISAKTVRKNLVNLEKMNFIVIDRERSTRGRFPHKVYHLINKSEWTIPSVKNTDGNEGEVPSVNEDDQHREYLPTKNTQNKKTQEKNTQLMLNFDLFWSCYPRKVGKAKAVEVWKRLKPDESLLREILNAVTEQNENDRWEDYQYIPYPAKWLQDKRWEDED